MTGMQESRTGATLQADLFDIVFENSPNILMLVDNDVRIERINRTGSQFAGAPHEKLIGLLGGEVFRCVNSFNGKGCGRNPECGDCPVRTRITRSFQKGETILNEEGRLTVRNEAQEVPVDFLISTVPVKVSNEIKVLVTIVDITERKKSEEELRKSKLALEEAERLVHLGHYEIDVTTGETIWSDEIFNIFGLDPSEGEPTVEAYERFVHPEDRSKVNEHFEESARNGVPFDLTYRIIRTDSKIRYVRSNASVIRNDPENLKLFGTFQDITELKQAELALEESESLYHDLVETAQDLIWQCDWEGRYVYLNPAWEGVLGYNLDEMLGKPFTDFQPPEYAKRDTDAFLRLMSGDTLARHETVHLTKDGREVQLVFKAKAVHDSQGNIIGIRGTAYDNTEREQVERGIREYTAQLESIREVGLELASQLDLNVLLRFIAKKAVGLLDASAGGVYLYRPEEDVLEWSVGINSPLPAASVLKRGEGLAGKVWLSGTSMSVDDYLHWEGRAEAYDRFAIGAAVAAPIFLRHDDGKDEFLGVLSVDRTDAFSEADLKLLSFFTTQAAVAIRNAQLYDLAQHEIEERARAEHSLRRHADELAALQKTILEITQSHTLGETLKFIVERAADLVGASGGGLYLNEPEQQQVRCVVSYNTVKDYTGTTLPYGVGAAGQIAQTGRALIIDDYRTWLDRADAYEEEQPFQAVMSAPLLWQGNVAGVLHMLRDSSQKFTQEDLNLLTLFANHASVAVENARLYTSIEQELSERKRAEEALRNSSYLLKESEKIASMGHYVLDIDTGVWESSDSLNVLFGIDEEFESNIEGWLQIVHPYDREFMAAYFAHEVVENHQEFDCEYRIVRLADGITRWVHGLGRLEFDGNGNLIRMIGNIQDITERKIAELALQEREAKLQSIFRAAPVGIGMILDRVIQEVNQSLCQLTGYTREELIGQNALMLYPSIKEYEYVGTEKYRMIKKMGVGTVETHWKCKNGEIRNILLSSVPLDLGDLSKGVTFTALDITSRKQVEDSLRKKTDELESLFSISSHLRVAKSADEMLSLVLVEMQRVLHSDSNAVILLEPDDGSFILALADGPISTNNGIKLKIGEGISSLVMQTRKPYVTDNLSEDPNKASHFQSDDNLGPAVFVPVVSELEFLGVLLSARSLEHGNRSFSTSEVQLLTAIGEMVGNALRRTRLYDQALKRLQHVQTLHSIDMAISANLDLSVTLDLLLTQGIAQLNVDAGSILLLNPHTHMLEYAAGHGFRSKDIKSTRLRLGDGLPGKVALERRVLQNSRLPELEGLARKYLLEEGFNSYLAAPLIAKGQIHGVMEVFTRKSVLAEDEQLGFLETLATQAAIAIDNSLLFHDLQRSNFELEMAYDATIEGWSRALELRDQDTEGHTLRVTEMTLQLAQAMGVKSSDLIHMRRGGLLHDIGKMGVPDRILLKPGKLDGEEWEIMKRHTIYAFEMLWPIEFLRPSLDIPRYHHERWDGTGYPNQLKGEQIPLSARLFAVADVWDALTSDRPYRKARSEKEAFEYITAQAGKHFDPRVVEAFLILRSKNR